MSLRIEKRQWNNVQTEEEEEDKETVISWVKVGIESAQIDVWHRILTIRKYGILEGRKKKPLTPFVNTFLVLD